MPFFLTMPISQDNADDCDHAKIAMNRQQQQQITDAATAASKYG